MLYNSNFKQSTQTSREFNRTIDDPCFIQQQSQDNSKKLKFVTTNHLDLLNAKNDLNFYGISIKNQLFVPSENIDQFSSLRQGQSGNIITNCNIKNEYGQLPFPTMPSKYQTSHGDINQETILTKSNYVVNRKTCNPKDTAYYNRSFYLFENVEAPNALKSVETSQMGPRGGISTRFSNKK